MKQIITIIILTLTISCSGPYSFNRFKISGQTEKIVGKITALKILAGRAVGEGGVRPEEYDNFVELKNKATNDELTELTNHPNGVVRCYAFWALSYDSTANLLPIIIRHLDDTLLVRTLFGCRGGEENVGDFFIEVARQSVDQDSKQLTPEEYAYLDSVLIYTPNKLYARDRAINRAKLTESFYRRTRELVLKENDQTALIALAKFRRKEDIPLILKNKAIEGHGLFYTHKAISEFPDPAFRPLLSESLHDALKNAAWDSDWREMYEAIASFKDDTAYQLLKEPFAKIEDQDRRRFHMELVFGAIRRHYSPIYDDLLWEMWENEKMISPDIFQLLYRQQPQRAFQLTKRAIKNAEHLYYRIESDYTEYGKKPLGLVDMMLDTIIAHDRALAVESINENIRSNDVPLFPTYVDKVLELKDNSCVRSLFARLEKENNANAYLKMAEVLIAFDDKDINSQIVEVSRRNANMRQGWGGEAFNKLLKDHNIAY